MPTPFQTPAAPSSSPVKRLSIVRVIVSVLLGVGMFALGFALRGLIISSETNLQLLSPLSSIQVKEKPTNPYAAYTFDALRTLNLNAEPITLHEAMDSQPTFTTYLASWSVPNLSTGQKQKVSAQVNVPTGRGPFPVIIMLRGYADREIYTTGLGTRNAAAAFARSGYITVAPDFLGYGTSDAESSDVLLARFARPITVLQLLANLDDLRLELDAAANPDASENLTLSNTVSQALFDTGNIGIWAHSNGGQIALSILEITSRTLPTTLWAPVSKPFPYSVLYYTDELEDNGAYIRQQLANFEYVLENDVDNFTILHEPSRILAPIQIHQGGADDAVPLEWSQELAEVLEDATVSAELFTYPEADHNLTPNWDTAVQRDLQFFTRHLK